MPKRSPKSKRGIWAEISSIPQQARPNCSHHSDERRAQLKRKSNEVTKTFCSNRSSVDPMVCSLCLRSGRSRPVAQETSDRWEP
jgi:hypothetical protein